MRFSHEVLARWPYLVLVAAACPTILTCMTMASGDESGLTGLDAIIHDVGLFFFPGKVASNSIIFISPGQGYLLQAHTRWCRKLAKAFEKVTYASGDIVIKQGDAGLGPQHVLQPNPNPY